MESPSRQNTRRAYLSSIIVGVGLVVTALIFAQTLGGPADSNSFDRPPTPSQAVSAYAPSRIHGVSMDRLDNPLEKSLTLEEALSKTGLEIVLPDSSVVGLPVKVVLDETAGDPSGKHRVGLMVLYDSGIKLIVEPGLLDLKDRNSSLKGALPFRDGRTLPYDLQTVAGRPTLIGEPGVQYQGSAELGTEANILWNMGDAHYWLRAPLPTQPGTPAQQGASGLTAPQGLSPEAATVPVGTDTLTMIAKSMVPAAK